MGTPLENLQFPQEHVTKMTEAQKAMLNNKDIPPIDKINTGKNPTPPDSTTPRVIIPQTEYHPTSYEFDGYTPILSWQKDKDGNEQTSYLPQGYSIMRNPKSGRLSEGDLNLRQTWNNHITSPTAWDTDGKNDVSPLAVNNSRLEKAKLLYNRDIVGRKLAEKYPQQWEEVKGLMEGVDQQFADELRRTPMHKRKKVSDEIIKAKNRILEELSAKGRTNMYLSEEEQNQLFGENAQEDDYLRNKYIPTSKARGKNEKDAASASKTLWGVRNYYNVPDAKAFIFDGDRDKDNGNMYLENNVNWDGNEFTVNDMGMYRVLPSDPWPTSMETHVRKMKPKPRK